MRLDIEVAPPLAAFLAPGVVVDLYWDGDRQRTLLRVRLGGHERVFEVRDRDGYRITSPDPYQRACGVKEALLPAAQWCARVLTLERGPYG